MEIKLHSFAKSSILGALLKARRIDIRKFGGVESRMVLPTYDADQVAVKVLAGGKDELDIAETYIVELSVEGHLADDSTIPIVANVVIKVYETPDFTSSANLRYGNMAIESAVLISGN